MGWRGTYEEMEYDNFTSQTRKRVEERGRERKTGRGRELVWEGGGLH